MAALTSMLRRNVANSTPARCAVPAAHSIFASLRFASVLLVLTALAMPPAILAQGTGAVATVNAGTGADASRYSAAVATEWFRVVLPAIQQTPGQSPPVAARTLAYLSLGLYESIIAGMPGQRSLTGQLSDCLLYTSPSPRDS